MDEAPGGTIRKHPDGLEPLVIRIRLRCELERAVQLILWLASAVPNEAGSSPLLVLLPAVSWPWVPAWGSLEPLRRAGENAQKTRKNGEEMAEIQPKKCEGRELTKDQLGGRERGNRSDTHIAHL